MMRWRSFVFCVSDSDQAVADVLQRAHNYAPCDRAAFIDLVIRALKKERDDEVDALHENAILDSQTGMTQDERDHLG